MPDEGPIKQWINMPTHYIRTLSFRDHTWDVIYQCTLPNNNHSIHNKLRSIEYLHLFAVGLSRLVEITRNMLFSEPVALSCCCRTNYCNTLMFRKHFYFEALDTAY